MLRATRLMSLFAVALFAAACGGSAATAAPTQAPSAAPTATPAEVPTTAATAAPTAAGSATVALSDAGNLVGANGLTLYVFDNDSAGTSTCNEGCAPTWPALTIDAGQQPQAGDGVTGELGTSDRTDGTTQVTLNGRPLYFFAGDSAPGDTNGDGIGGIWHIAKPS